MAPLEVDMSQHVQSQKKESGAIFRCEKTVTDGRERSKQGVQGRRERRVKQWAFEGQLSLGRGNAERTGGRYLFDSLPPGVWEGE